MVGRHIGYTILNLEFSSFIEPKNTEIIFLGRWFFYDKFGCNKKVFNIDRITKHPRRSRVE